MNLKLNFIAKTLGTIPLLYASVANANTALQSPWDLVPPSNITFNKHITCKPSPRISPNLDVNGFYIRNGYGDTPDEKKLISLKQETENIKNSITKIINISDNYNRTGNAAYATCGSKLLARLAQEKALTGKMTHSQAYFEQSWALTGYAIAWLKIRNSNTIEEPQKIKIVKWLEDIAQKNLQYWDQQNKKPGNILYSAGLGVMSAGISANNRELYNWGLSTFDVALHDITNDRYLLQETKRGKKALSYENTDGAILSTMAQLAAVNGDDLYAKDNFKLDKFIKNLIATLNDPAKLEKVTHVKQNKASEKYTQWIKNYDANLEQIELSNKIMHKYPDKKIDFYKTGGDPAPVTLNRIKLATPK